MTGAGSGCARPRSVASRQLRSTSTPLAEAIASVEHGSRRARPFACEAQRPRHRTARSAASPTSPRQSPRRRRRARAASERVRAAPIGSRRRADGTTLPAPALSVVIPSYDQAAFVAAAVESALAAVGVELEVVVVDDRSTDESAALVRGAPRGATTERALKLVERGDNEGLSAARNRGFLEARAPLVLLLDADDELLPHGPAALHRRARGRSGCRLRVRLPRARRPRARGPPGHGALGSGAVPRTATTCR